MEAGHELIVITSLHEAKRDVLKVIRASTRVVRLRACFTRARRRDRTHSAASRGCAED